MVPVKFHFLNSLDKVNNKLLDQKSARFLTQKIANIKVSYKWFLVTKVKNQL